MGKLLLRLWTEESGQDLTEYALLVVLLALAAIVAMQQSGCRHQQRILKRRLELDRRTRNRWELARKPRISGIEQNAYDRY